MEYLPHQSKDSLEKLKEAFSKKPKDLIELNTIFFKNKYEFFKEIDKNYKNEGEEFLKIYENLRNLALDIENIIPPEIKIMKKNTKQLEEKILTRKQVALIFLLSFFNLIDISHEKKYEVNHFAVYEVLKTLDDTKFEFARCFLNYLTNIGRWLSNNNDVLNEKIIYIRDSKKKIKYEETFKDKDLCEIKINEKDSIFDGKASYYIDFANMFIGGGVLEGGCVQEEILFAVHPEAIVAMFFM